MKKIIDLKKPIFNVSDPRGWRDNISKIEDELNLFDSKFIYRKATTDFQIIYSHDWYFYYFMRYTDYWGLCARLDKDITLNIVQLQKDRPNDFKLVFGSDPTLAYVRQEYEIRSFDILKLFVESFDKNRNKFLKTEKEHRYEPPSWDDSFPNKKDLINDLEIKYNVVK